MPQSQHKGKSALRSKRRQRLRFFPRRMYWYLWLLLAGAVAILQFSQLGKYDSVLDKRPTKWRDTWRIVKLREESHLGFNADMFQYGGKPAYLNIFAKKFSTYPNLSTDVLPDMTTERGGIIFYLHVPKTGGSSIRNHLGVQKLSKSARRKYNLPILNISNATINQIQGRVQYVNANYLERFWKLAVPKIRSYLQGPTPRKTVLFVEVHGMDNYNAIELEPFLQTWRNQSKDLDVPFFAFTTLREAVSGQISFFNFYYIHPGDPRFCNNRLVTSTLCQRAEIKRKRKARQRGAANVTIDEGGKLLFAGTPDNGSLKNYSESELRVNRTLLNIGVDLERAIKQLAYENPQCLFLARGERTFGVNHTDSRNNLQTSECQFAYQSLRRTMDWIGTTERLSQETMPLITTMIFKDPDLGRTLPRSNTSPQESGFLYLSRISSGTRRYLETISRLDDEMYRWALQDYNITKWKN